MANLGNGDREVVGGITQVSGATTNPTTGGVDTITLSSGFLLGGTSQGLIDGLGGDDTLILTSSNLENVDIENIEFTQLTNNGTLFIDADELDDLGALTINNTFAGQNTSRDANIRLNFTNTVSPTSVSLAPGTQLNAEERLYISTTGQSAGDQITLDFSNVTMVGDAVLEYDGAAADETITGTSGDDNLSGSSGTNSISGGSGDDTLDASSGLSTLEGGDGNDSITGTSVSGLFDGGADNDQITVNSSRFTSGAFAGTTILGGTGMDNILVNGTQADGIDIDAGDDDDTITMRDGTMRNGTVDGGGGTNALRLTNVNLEGTDFSNFASTTLISNGTVTLDADEIADLGALDITDVFTNTSFDANLRLNYLGLSTTTAINTVFAALGDLAANERISVTTTGQTAGQQAVIDFSAIARGASDDSLLRYTGGVADETITGTAGDDDLRASSGTNSAVGGDGNDLLSATNGFSTLEGGVGNDTLTGSSTSGLFDGGLGNDSIEVSSAFFTAGATQSSRLIGGVGEDEITVRSTQGDGSEVLAGSENDTIRMLNTTFRNGTVDGGSGTDELRINNANMTGTDFIGIENTVFTANATNTIDADEVADLGAIDITNTFNNTTTFDANLRLNYAGLSTTTAINTSLAGLSDLGDNERFNINTTGQVAGQMVVLDFSGIARPFADSLFTYIGSVADETITGTSGADGINASSGTHSIVGGGGDDTLDASTGLSTILGGEGADDIGSSSTSGLFDGGMGNDTLDISTSFFTAGVRQTSTILGGEGMDDITVRSAQGNGTRIDAGTEDDIIRMSNATVNNGTVDGGTGTDQLRITNTNLIGTDITGIESTVFTSNGTVTVDADEVVDLGTIDITNVFTNTSFDANLRLNYGGLSTTTPINTSLGTLAELAAGERFNVDTTGQATGQQAVLDFSGIARPAADTLFRYSGGVADETVTGTSGADEILVSSGTNSVTGGDGDDLITAGTGFSTLLGGEGADEIRGSSTSGLFEGGAGNDSLDVNVGFFTAGARQVSTILGGAGMDEIIVRSSHGDGTQVDGGTEDDTITLVSATLNNSTLDGGAGTNALRMSSTNLVNTDISNFASTTFTNNGTNTIDADQIADLGTIDIINTFNNASTIDANLRLNYGGLSTTTAINTSLSGVTELADNERLAITTLGQTAGQQAIIDLSGIGRATDDTTLNFTGGIADETVTGTTGADQISLGTGTNEANGGLGDDTITASTGLSTINGGAGNDSLTFNSNTSGLIDAGADDDIVRINAGNNVSGTPRAATTVLGGTGMDTINVFSSQGEGSQIDAGDDNDTIDLNSVTMQNSALDGGAGTDGLTVRSTNLSGTDIEGIENTLVLNNGTFTVDAAQVADLGALTVTDVFTGQNTTRDANISISNGVGETADFSNLTLTDNQRLFVSLAFGPDGETTIDMSGVSGTATSVIEFSGRGGNNRDEVYVASALTDIASGGTTGSDTISYAGSDAAVTVNLGTNTVSGGFADGDTISNFENATGSAFGDMLIGSTGNNILRGLGGDDTYTSDNGDDIVVVSVGNGNDTWSDFASSGGLNRVDLRDLPKDAAILAFLTATEVGGNTVLNFNTGGSITLVGEALADFDISDVILEDGVYAIDETFTTDEDTVQTGNIISDNPPFNFTDLEIRNQMNDGATNLEIQDFTVDGQTALAGNTLSFNSGATLTVNADGSFTYDGTTATDVQALNELLGDTLAQNFSYTVVSTLTNETDEGDVTLTVTAVNDAPMTSGEVTLSVMEDDATETLNLLSTWTDADRSETLTVVNPDLLSTGFSRNGADYTVTPGATVFQSLNEGEVQVDVFNYDVEDTFGAVTSGGVARVTITGVNDDPTIQNGVGAATEDGAVTTVDLSALGDDADNEDDGTTLTYTIVTQPGEGSASINGTDLEFNPGGDFQDLAEGDTRQVIVQVQATDARNATSNISDVVITVTGTNDAPQITSVQTAFSVPENTSAVTTITSLDPDEGDPATFAIAGGADAALFQIDSTTGALSFISAPDFETPLDAGGNNVYDVDVSVSDGIADPVTQSLEVTVTDVPEAGVATVSIGVQPTSVTEGDSGQQSVTYTVTRTGVATNPVTVNLALAGTATAGTDFTGTVPTSVTLAANETSASFTILVNGDTDVELDETVEVSITSVSRGDHDIGVSAATHTILNDDVAGPVTFYEVEVTPTEAPEGDSGSTPVAFVVTRSGDTTGISTVDIVFGGSATLGVDVTGAGTGVPTTLTFVGGQTTMTVAPSIVGDTDVEADETLVATLSNPSTGSAITTGSVTYTILNDDVAQGDPTAVDDGPFAVNEDTGGTTGNVLNNDDDPNEDILSVQSADAVTRLGAIVIDNGDGTFDIRTAGAYEDLNAGETITDDFEYVVTDGNGVDTGLVTLTVTGVNDAPTLIDGTGTAREDNGVSVVDLSALGDDADDEDDGASLTYNIIGAVSEGSAQINGSTLEFDVGNDFQDLGAGDTRDVTVQIQATDMRNATSTVQDVVITVTGVDDLPVFQSAAAFAIDENTTAVGTVSATDVDADAPVTYSIQGGADASLFSINTTTGALSFVTAPDFEAPLDQAGVGPAGDNVYEVTVRADGGAGSVADQAIAVTVNDVDEGPVLNFINGTSGSDRLTGTIENEIFVSMAGRYDRMEGGGGADTFVFGDELSNGARERDLISDFDADDDVILLADNNFTVVDIRSGVLITHGDDLDRIYVIGEDVDTNSIQISIGGLDVLV